MCVCTTARRLRSEGVEGVTVNALTPGLVRTNIQHTEARWKRLLMSPMFLVVGKVLSV